MKKNKIEHYSDKEALDFHTNDKSGKIEIVSSKPVTTKRDLALAYSPGVAAPVKAIADNPELAYEYTTKGNLVAVISNGSAILGLGNLGAIASKPSLRGFSGDRFLLTKDGNKVGDLSQSSIDHAIALDMTEVSQIEIIRGPKSLLYGPNTIGGVINTSIVGNPKMRVDKLSTKIIFGSESFNPKGSSLYNQGLYGNVFVRVKDIDGYEYAGELTEVMEDKE